MIEYRRNALGDAIIPIKDFPLDETYATTAKKGDMVKLSGGVVVKSVVADATVLGVFEGPCIRLDNESPVGKVRAADSSIYEVDYYGGTPSVGFSYAFGVLGSDGTTALNVGVTANPTFKVLALVPGTTRCEVMIHPSARIFG